VEWLRCQGPISDHSAAFPQSKLPLGVCGASSRSAKSVCGDSTSCSSRGPVRWFGVAWPPLPRMSLACMDEGAAVTPMLSSIVQPATPVSDVMTMPRSHFARFSPVGKRSACSRVSAGVGLFMDGTRTCDGDGSALESRAIPARLHDIAGGIPAISPIFSKSNFLDRAHHTCLLTKRRPRRLATDSPDEAHL
jgi:hypothetical protein